MSKFRKWNLREPKFAKFHGGACPKTPLEARASGAKKYLPKHKRTPLNRIHPTGLLTPVRGLGFRLHCWLRITERSLFWNSSVTSSLKSKGTLTLSQIYNWAIFIWRLLTSESRPAENSSFIKLPLFIPALLFIYTVYAGITSFEIQTDPLGISTKSTNNRSFTYIVALC